MASVSNKGGERKSPEMQSPMEEGIALQKGFGMKQREEEKEEKFGLTDVVTISLSGIGDQSFLPSQMHCGETEDELGTLTSSSSSLPLFVHERCTDRIFPLAAFEFRGCAFLSF